MIGLPGKVGRKGLRGVIGKPGHKGSRGLLGPILQDSALERIVRYFDDVHAELLELHGQFAQLNKTVEKLSARFETGDRNG